MQTDQIIIYQTTDGQTAIDAKLENETVWLIPVNKVLKESLIKVINLLPLIFSHEV